MSFRKVSLALLTGLALVAAGCGGDDEPADQDTGTQPASAETTAGEPTNSDTGEPADPGEVTELGSFTIDGTVFAVTTLNRCEPFGGGDDIDQQALAQGAKLNLY
ncbi:MAG: hypothetical protein R3249_12015, partial [Nitriliruptorales bacterium]|nr:hypothetical protein [Nitriliruptorales bacterium]